jgi:hypothetical protein
MTESPYQCCGSVSSFIEFLGSVSGSGVAICIRIQEDKNDPTSLEKSSQDEGLTDFSENLCVSFLMMTYRLDLLSSRSKGPGHEIMLNYFDKNV